MPNSEGRAFNLGPSSQSIAQINTTQTNIEKEKKKSTMENQTIEIQTFSIAFYTDLLNPDQRLILDFIVPCLGL